MEPQDAQRRAARCAALGRSDVAHSLCCSPTQPACVNMNPLQPANCQCHQVHRSGSFIGMLGAAWSTYVGLASAEGESKSWTGHGRARASCEHAMLAALSKCVGQGGANAPWQAGGFKGGTRMAWCGRSAARVSRPLPRTVNPTAEMAHWRVPPPCAAGLRRQHAGQ